MNPLERFLATILPDIPAENIAAMVGEATRVD
jgi:hypothetical protein